MITETPSDSTDPPASPDSPASTDSAWFHRLEEVEAVMQFSIESLPAVVSAHVTISGLPQDLSASVTCFLWSDADYVASHVQITDVILPAAEARLGVSFADRRVSVSVAGSTVPIPAPSGPSRPPTQGAGALGLAALVEP